MYKNINKNFFKKWSPNMAYVVGFFAADGYITVNKRGGQFWSIQITDRNLLVQIKKVIRSDHKISIRISKKDTESVLYRLQIGSIEMCDDLRRLGFKERKTKNLAVPNIPKKYFSDFIRGYFDGDGNVWMGFMHKNRLKQTRVVFVAFTSASLEFLTQLHNRLKNEKIEGGSIYKPKNKNFSRLQFSTKSALKLYNFMYNREVKDFNGLYLKRKKKVFDEFLKLRL